MIGEFLFLVLATSLGATSVNNNIINSAIEAHDEADALISQNIQNRGFNYSDANIVRHYLNSGENEYECFNPNYYLQKSSSINNTRDYHSHNSEDSFDYLNNKIVDRHLIGNDDRVIITNPSQQPYLPTAKIVSIFSSESGNITVPMRGTGFMIGPNLLATAAHCVYDDYTVDEFDNNIYDPEFATTVRIFCGISSNDVQNENYQYYAEATVINIQKSYHIGCWDDYDWAILELDRNLGNYTGWYNITPNWYSYGEDLYSYGYPSDLGDRNMCMAPGQMLGHSTYRYQYSIDTYGGQSGAPVFMEDNQGAPHVIAIHTMGETIYNSGTIINTFIYEYIQSFFTSKNYAATIHPSDYGYSDAYANHYTIAENFITHNLNNSFNFYTRRYRCGYIHNEYIVTSPIRQTFTEAFIEYQFDYPVLAIDVDLSHWREFAHEWLDKTTGTATIQLADDYYEDDWYDYFDLLADSTALPRDRSNPTTYRIEFPSMTYGFRFYSSIPEPRFNNDNRGRICIGDMNVYINSGYFDN
ncbi:MAG: trypsin-like peptidase domain-containing protein [Bacilli bacterium]|nr:trypsin-like peptidase domain-containing protein [Bacilli bacterium]